MARSWSCKSNTRVRCRLYVKDKQACDFTSRPNRVNPKEKRTFCRKKLAAFTQIRIHGHKRNPAVDLPPLPKRTALPRSHCGLKAERLSVRDGRN